MNKFRAVLRRRWPLLIVTLAVGLVAGVVSGQLATKDVRSLFTASQTVVTNRNSGTQPLVPQDELKVTRGAVPVRAAKILGAPGKVDQLVNTIQTTFDDKSSSITIASDDISPSVAAKRVAAFVQAFLEITNADLAKGSGQLASSQQTLREANRALSSFDTAHPGISQPGSASSTDPAVQELVNQRAGLVAAVEDGQQQLKRLADAAAYQSLGPEAPHPAETGLISVPTSPPIRAGLLGLFGLMLGALVAIVIERLNRRIDTREELAEIVDLPIIAEIGFIPEKKRGHDGDGNLLLSGVWAEPYRRIRSAIQFVQANEPTEHGSVFLMTSASPGEGKSTSAALTAQALAEVGIPTVVVGGDFRRPEIDRLLGVPRDPSLQDMARLDVGRASVDDVVHKSRYEGLWVAPAGRGTREVVGLIEAAREVCDESKRRGATVVVDSSPLQAANDTIDLLPSVDYVIMVIRAGSTTEANLLDAVAMLRRMDAKILGLVLIGTKSMGKQQVYYYDYYTPSDGLASPSTHTEPGANGSAPPKPVKATER